MVGGVPQHMFTPVVDVSTGLSMAWAICAALYARERTGRGQKIEASLLSNALAMQGSRFLQVKDTDTEIQEALLEEVALAPRAGCFLRGGAGPLSVLPCAASGHIYYRMYQTRDGALAVGC